MPANLAAALAFRSPPSWPKPVPAPPAPVTPAFRLPTIPYRRLRVRLEAPAGADLSAYKGSMLRGAFGHTLRRAVCVMGPDTPCAGCDLRSVCAHARLFEPSIDGPPPPFFRGLRSAPRPIVFEVSDSRTQLDPGATLDFDLVLLADAVPLEPYARLAIERAASGGLGRGRQPFRVLSLAATDGLLGDDGGPPLGPRVTLRFLTPTRIASRGTLLTAPTKRQLIYHCLRRPLEIAAFHLAGATVDWSFRPLLDLADRLTVVAADLVWQDWRRYSNRQHAAMTLGGFVGTLTLAGDLAPFTPILRAAEVLHVGKGVTFGMGWVRVEPVPQSKEA
jgi:hypothetical protein